MYREVTMIEVREVLRLRGAGLPKKRIAAQLGLDPKTVRRYLAAAATAGVRVDGDESATRRSARCCSRCSRRAVARAATAGRGVASSAPAIERWLGDGLRLTKIRKLLVRQGVAIAYPTLHRFAVLELQFGKTATTIPVLDGEPGQELQLDTGWVGWLTLPAGKRRRFRAWIFTAVRSRHRFVYPTFEETTARAIEACEAAWEFFGGIFTVLIPDNTKAIIVGADPPMVLEAWDTTAKVTLDRTLLNELASLRFLDAHAHVAIVGPVGVGKTFLAQALGHIACRRGATVLAVRTDAMLKTLKHARLDHSYDAELRKLVAVECLARRSNLRRIPSRRRTA